MLVGLWFASDGKGGVLDPRTVACTDSLKRQQPMNSGNTTADVDTAEAPVRVCSPGCRGGMGAEHTEEVNNSHGHGTGCLGLPQIQ